MPKGVPGAAEEELLPEAQLQPRPFAFKRMKFRHLESIFKYRKEKIK